MLEGNKGRGTSDKTAIFQQMVAFRQIIAKGKEQTVPASQMPRVVEPPKEPEVVDIWPEESLEGFEEDAGVPNQAPAMTYPMDSSPQVSEIRVVSNPPGNKIPAPESAPRGTIPAMGKMYFRCLTCDKESEVLPGQYTGPRSVYLLLICMRSV
jgi:hypothetical protein